MAASDFYRYQHVRIPPVRTGHSGLDHQQRTSNSLFVTIKVGLTVSSGGDPTPSEMIKTDSQQDGILSVLI